MEKLKNGNPQSTGIGTTHRVYDSKMQVKEYQIQIDIV
jgi:hypothetical protein